MSEPRFEFDDLEEKSLEEIEEEFERAEAEKVYKKFGLEGRKEQYWAKIAKIALLRFPELQEGERISFIEIKKRLTQIKMAGYHTKSYSHMNIKEISDYFFKEVKSDIYKNAGDHCPNVLKDIKRENERRKLEARL